MANILKCKMCGGDIEVSQDMTVGKCLYCGSTMTLPRIDSDKKARLFNRANAYRLNNEFDKAYDAYSGSPPAHSFSSKTHDNGIDNLYETESRNQYTQSCDKVDWFYRQTRDAIHSQYQHLF